MSYQLCFCQLLILQIHRKNKVSKIYLVQCIIYKWQLFWKSQDDTLHYFSSYFSTELKQFVKNMLYYKHKLILLQFYPFSLSLLCQFCANITNNPLDFHFLLFHLQNVITSIIILLAFGGGSVKAANFPRTVSCLFFTNFCSLFLLLVLYCCCYY